MDLTPQDPQNPDTPIEESAPTEGAVEKAAASESSAPAGEAPAGEAPATDDAASGDKPKKKKKKKAGKKAARKKARRRAPPKHVEPPLPPELKEEAAQAARARVLSLSKSSPSQVEYAIDALQKGVSIPFLARFRRSETAGMDERRLRNLRDGLAEITQEEERRTGIRALLKKRGALDEKTAAALESAETIAAMEDLAAPYLPVTASRATMARGQGLQGLADAIRSATEAQPLSELAKGVVPEGAEPTAFDIALGGARDILAEELSLDAGLRARLRALFLKEGILRVAARTEKRKESHGDVPHDAEEAAAPAGEAEAEAQPAAHEGQGKESKGKGARPPRGGKGAKPAAGGGSLIGFSAKAAKVPPMKILAIRRAEKQRQAVATIEPPEESAIAAVHKHAVPEDHPHAGFLRAAAEDGYRRILKPMLQNEVRLTLKQRADDYAMDQFERALRNSLLGPYAGPRRTLGLRPDVMNGHRWCVIDEAGQAAGSGQLPHEPTAGREACLTELTDVLKTYEVSAIAVGTSGGRADALALAKEAAKDIEKKIDVTEVSDGGTRALEGMGPVEFENHLTVPAECRGALSLARRFQDPLTELVRVDPKALALGPHLHEVHQGRLRTMLDDVLESCVAHTGVDPNTADFDLLLHVPGFDRKSTQAFLTYREGAGPLKAKAELAAIDGVGPQVAEQAVGFLRIGGAADPRDRTQMHPEQFAVAEKMAEQVGVDLSTLFSDPEARKKVKLDALADGETTLAAAKHVLYEASLGQKDPRPRFTQLIPPPPGFKLADLASPPGLMVQGRVIRAAPFGIFLDVGLGIEALIPTPHIGDRPGLEPSTVAPVGAVISARVLEVEPQKKRLTLSMRQGAPARSARGPGGRPPRGGERGPRAPRGPGGPGAVARTGAPRGASDRPAGQGPRSGGDRRPGGQGPRSGGDRRPAGAGAGTGGPRRGADARGGGRTGGRQRKPGRFEGGGGSFGGRGDRHDRNTPRSISLKPDEAETPKVDESKMTPEELLAFKLEQMKRKLERPNG